VGPALYFPKEEFLCQNLEGLRLAVLAMVLIVFGGVPDSVLGDIDAILKMEDTEVSCEGVSNDSLALEKLVNFLLGLLKGFGFVHMMRGHS
jgi:hypothetical protein